MSTSTSAHDDDTNTSGDLLQPRGSIDRRSLAESYVDVPPSPGVPKLPEPHFDTSLSLDLIIAESSIGDEHIAPEKKEKVQKRQSNVLRLAQENEKLNAELQAMSARLRAAEEKAQRLLEQRRQEQEAAVVAAAAREAAPPPVPDKDEPGSTSVAS